MAVISIVGTSGAGKSLLASQLASLNSMPVFLEGEEGVIPAEVLTNVFDENPLARYEYFIERYRKHLVRARQISDAGLDAYVDGATISPEAILRYEPEIHHAAIRDAARVLEGNEADLVVLLTATPEKLAEAIQSRGRSSEQHGAALERAVAIQNHFIEIVSGMDSVLVIDRTEINFFDETRLREIDAQIKARPQSYSPTI